MPCFEVCVVLSYICFLVIAITVKIFFFLDVEIPVDLCSHTVYPNKYNHMLYNIRVSVYDPCEDLLLTTDIIINAMFKPKSNPDVHKSQEPKGNILSVRFF